MTRPLLAVGFALVLALVGVAATAEAATPGGAIAALNAQRTANGFPGTVVENAAWSLKCAAHDRYMATNHLLTHVESPSAPGYTADGAWAGTNAVLAYRGGFTNPSAWATDPWENAPFHLAQALQPGNRTVGYDDDGVYACLTTWPGVVNSGLAGKVFTYPGAGRTDVPTQQVASELPSTPQQNVGIAATATTGPNLIVYAYGFGNVLHVTRASLTPAVPIKWVDNTTPSVGGVIPSGAILVPVTPLQPATTYTASVTLAGAIGSTTHRWTFTTSARPSSVVSATAGAGGPAGGGAAATRLKASFRKSGAHRVRISGTAAAGRVTLQLTPRRGRAVRRRVRVAASGVFSGVLTTRLRGRLRACAVSGRLRVCTTIRL
jgi:hypothetical protein